MHDLFLSSKPIRNHAFKVMFNWITDKTELS